MFNSAAELKDPNLCLFILDTVSMEGNCPTDQRRGWNVRLFLPCSLNR
jgi:hypothetical protein